ncbi:23S rRNA (uracil(1939)-C(5))-methyltransferase RlmD [Peptoniphilus equinus]|uniref:23S rRNA (Uracil(1939)-C(5))-methyltransferase RlmD n=1 Tax=Peptoniphilus equinus TaxID=3016343 RepID=A0ABY7QSY9_9FIRM|nr:23S rRNA (uracil(1939)-C(5))-methyltransferase RlmD [Peptoniphilus equinus]WBW49908.1 23S rRNA (uracil(1939)-C(5))-methyltransferase RlmD [Peptoniphilus equinus]
MKKDQIGKIIRAEFPNRTVADVDGREIKLKGGLLGQTVRLHQSNRKKGKLLEVLERGPMEEAAHCPRADICGGCTYQTLSYDKEVVYKGALLKQLYQKELGMDLELIPSPMSQAYRNKMEYTFSDAYKDGPLSLGLHQKNRFYDVVDTEGCNIIHEDFNTLRSFTRDYFDGVLKPYHKRLHTGVLRHLLIRRSGIGEIVLSLVTANSDYDFTDYFEQLKTLPLEGVLVGATQTINNSFSDAIVPEDVIIHFGRDYIEESLLGLTFKVSLFSFFQTNSASAAVLYTMAADMLGSMEGKTLVDLYSGTGTITQILGRHATTALGIEIVEEAVEAARENAKANGLDQVRFIAGDVAEVIKEEDIHADVIVLDPPREGINPKAIERIISFAPTQFLYISCNPITQVRDLHVFLDKGYHVDKLVALDQFPRTVHVECIALLTKIN